ncbi:MAG: hypothetical protein KDE59_09950 [Anaerolineales bacterium]|nr:hypothetical protein [Anaerolineales bacterium]
MKRSHLLLIFILLLAAALRLVWLTDFPPGLTHDEANNGREALTVLDGEFLYISPFGYGREPLYRYVVAGLMALIGPGLFALRLVNVFTGLLAIALSYRWAALALDRGRGIRPVALTAAAFMAVSFWPLATSREALRAGMMPALTAMAAILVWQLLPGGAKSRRGRLLSAVGLALVIGAAFHNYLAARVWWLLFPAFVLYLALVWRPGLRAIWRPLVVTGLLGAALVAPLFWYLRLHPEMQPRLQMFSETVAQLSSGQIRPFAENGLRALGAFVLPGFGDEFLAYNIPGRPLFDPLTGLFFIVGVIVALWHWRRPAYGFLLLWFGLGIVPSLATGATANTTRNMAALPTIYILLGIGLVTGVDWVRRHRTIKKRQWGVALAGALLLFVALRDGYDYFVRWSQDPDVRAAYQVNLIASLEYLDPAGPTVVSSVYPGPAHDISIAMTMLGTRSLAWRGVAANSALILPAGRPARLLVPTATPLHPYFQGWVKPLAQVSLRPDDTDPGFTSYELQPPAMDYEPVGVTLGAAVTLLGYQWVANPVAPGTVAELASYWQVLDPARVGPPRLPALLPDVNLFTHVLWPDGTIMTQQDLLGAPSWSWQAGDIVVQIHQLAVAPEIPAGSYQVVMGLYDPESGVRLRQADGSEVIGVGTLQVE